MMRHGQLFHTDIDPILKLSKLKKYPKPVGIDPAESIGPSMGPSVVVGVGAPGRRR